MLFGCSSAVIAGADAADVTALPGGIGFVGISLAFGISIVAVAYGLGAISGAVAGLVAITPAAGNVGIGGALIIGVVAGFLCLWGVSGLKKLIGADDSLDVFGVHGVGGIVGALLTGVFASPSLGGPSAMGDWVTATMLTPDAYSISTQVMTQLKAVLVTIVWSGVVSVIAYKLVDLVIGLRVPEEEEREGLDITSHGETAYSR